MTGPADSAPHRLFFCKWCGSRRTWPLDEQPDRVFDPSSDLYGGRQIECRNCGKTWIELDVAHDVQHALNPQQADGVDAFGGPRTHHRPWPHKGGDPLIGDVCPWCDIWNGSAQ